MRAMVLCAGYGTRLGDLTRGTPKSMLRLQSRLLLEHIICNLSRQGFDQIAINLYFMADRIRDHFGDGANWNTEITYSLESQLLGTAGGVKKMEGFLRQEEDFLVHYGDILTDQDFAPMVRFHREHRAIATLLVHQRVGSNSVVRMDDEGRIVGFLERPSDEVRQGLDSAWVNSGICVAGAQLLDTIPAEVACDLPRDVFPRIMATGRLFGFPASGYRCAIDSPERLAEARLAIADGRCRTFVPEDCAAAQRRV